MTTVTPQITIRRATQADLRILVRLAALDSKRLPDGPLLLAEAGGEVVAAVALAGGEVVADPFHRTAELVDLLELRAGQLRRREPARIGRPVRRRGGARAPLRQAA